MFCIRLPIIKLITRQCVLPAIADMAAPLGAMFTGQPLRPPPPPQGLPGQASLLQTAPGAKRSSNSTLVDELESSFEACFASLVSQDYVSGTDQEEIQTGVDQCIQKFLDIARQTECLFLQKRLQLSVQKPEQVIKEVQTLFFPSTFRKCECFLDSTYALNKIYSITVNYEYEMLLVVSVHGGLSV
jgi:hypothetical protein